MPFEDVESFARALSKERLQHLFFFLVLPLLPFLLKSAIPKPQVDLPEARARDQSDLAESWRAHLLMGLDLFVRAQRALHAETGGYRKMLGKVPDVLGSLAYYYRIEVLKATRGQLLVAAAGEGHKSSMIDGSAVIGDRVAVDEQFRVRSNFPIPSPPRDYLHTLARNVMNRIRNNQFHFPVRSTINLWEGVFQGYFRYEMRNVSRPDRELAATGNRLLVAVGMKAPVEGDVVEMAREGEVPDLYEWVSRYRATAWEKQELNRHLYEIYLAQRVHQEHSGVYAEGFKSLVSKWHGLAALSVESGEMAIQEFQPDPAFGFHAEVANRSPAGESRVWAVNGYGQISEISSIRTLMEQWERAKRRVVPSNDTYTPKTPEQVIKIVPLLIDPVESDK